MSDYKPYGEIKSKLTCPNCGTIINKVQIDKNRPPDPNDFNRPYTCPKCGHLVWDKNKY
jgi:predicted RNA-binding Zn-ribbon protein involved in translation (DUF1610 family)